MAEAASSFLMTINNLKQRWRPALSGTTARWLSFVILLRTTNNGRNPKSECVHLLLPSAKTAGFFFLWWDPVRSRTPSITVGSKSKINMCSDAIRQSSFYIQCSAKGYIASISPLCLWLSKWIINNCLQLKAALKFTSRPRGWHFTLFLPRLLVTHAKSIVSMRWWDLLL